MARDYNDYKTENESGYASTVALTINYRSHKVGNFDFGAQFVSSNTLFQHNPDLVSNNNLNLLNKVVFLILTMTLGAPMPDCL